MTAGSPGGAPRTALPTGDDGLRHATVGRPDSHIPGELLAKAARRIPRCELVTLPAGHHVHTGRPADFTAAVLGWLSRREPGSHPARSPW